MSRWRALHDSDQAVIVAQRQVPGRMGCRTSPPPRPGIVAAAPLPHVSYHFRAGVVAGRGKSFAAHQWRPGKQALWTLGGAPGEHRTDSPWRPRDGPRRTDGLPSGVLLRCGGRRCDNRAL